MNRYRTIASAIVSVAALGTALVGGTGCEQSKPVHGGVERTQDNTQHRKAEGANMGITKSNFGKTKEGEQVDLYTLANGKGVVAKIMTYGGIVTELHVPDKAGKTAVVVLGFNNLDQYLAGHPFFGAIAGRYANRNACGYYQPSSIPLRRQLCGC